MPLLDCVCDGWCKASCRGCLWGRRERGGRRVAIRNKQAMWSWQQERGRLCEAVDRHLSRSPRAPRASWGPGHPSAAEPVCIQGHSLCNDKIWGGTAFSFGLSLTKPGWLRWFWQLRSSGWVTVTPGAGGGNRPGTPQGDGFLSQHLLLVLQQRTSAACTGRPGCSYYWYFYF